MALLRGIYSESRILTEDAGQLSAEKLVRFSTMSRQAVQKRRKAHWRFTRGGGDSSYPAWEFSRTRHAAQRRKQGSILSSGQQVEIKQSGRLETDGGTKNMCSPHEKSAQTGDHTIPGVELGARLRLGFRINR
jgi:hypothetical protein